MRKYLITMLVCCTSLPGAPSGAEIPQDWQIVYVVRLGAPPGGTPEFTPDALRLLQSLQLQFHAKLEADGAALVSGVFMDSGDGAVMSVVCAGDAERARGIVEQDPAVQFGYLVVAEVRPWQVPVGRLPLCGAGNLEGP